MGVVLIKRAWLNFLYLQPHHSKNPRSAPVTGSSDGVL